MPENVRALVVVLALASLVFGLASSPARAIDLVTGEFERRRNIWYGITVSAFLLPNFWLFLILVAVLLYRGAIKDSNPVALVFFVLLAMPLIGVEIPGFAGIRYIFKINYFHVISLAILFPIFIVEAKRHSFRYFRDQRTDVYLYAYLILDWTTSFVAGGASDVTGALRGLFVQFVGIALPYAVVSRYLKDDAALLVAIASYVVGASVMAAVGIVESLRQWLLYTGIEKSLGIDWGLTIYLRRGNSLRAFASTGQAILFGYAMAIGFILMLGLRQHFQRRILWWAGLGLLFCGMLSSYSRGPWLGAAAGFLTFLLTGPRKWSNLGKLAVSGTLGLAILVATPLGGRLYDSAVTVDEGSYDYRVMVFQVSKHVILQHPIFGAKGFDIESQLESLRQGQGIIDIVNTYVSVALANGFVGLLLFIGFFLSAIFAIFKRMHSYPNESGGGTDLGRSLLGAIVCILVSIYTVSSIGIVPILYYLTVALAIAYARSRGTVVAAISPSPEPRPRVRRENRLKRGLFGNAPS